MCLAQTFDKAATAGHPELPFHTAGTMLLSFAGDINRT
jgi:hypothetical protein